MGGGFYEMHQHMAAHLLVADIVHGKGQKGDKSVAKCDGQNNNEAIRLHNWGDNFKFCTQNIEYPRTTAEVQQILRGTLLSTLGMSSIIAFNGSRPTVTVQPGITYTDLAPILYAKNFALPTLAGIAEITVGGATQTGAHGSGLSNSNLATQVRSMRVVLAIRAEEPNSTIS
ncbi:hypothetical protein niasHT_003469 [Heterodera trifolii]|uniref:FAD linked oxidase N-terminal domain-containing protein n=1 Tax=Heterodera trifolii TaxID=157864 RepID=A0ABD2M4J4_9BILA